MFNHKYARTPRLLLPLLLIGVLFTLSAQTALSAPLRRPQTQTTVVTPVTPKVVSSIPAPGNGVTGLAWGNNSLWVVDNDSTLFRLDAATGAVLQSMTLSPSVAELAWNEDGLWGHGASDNEVHRFDGAGQVVETLAIGYWSYGALEWAGGELYVSDYNSGTIHKYSRSGQHLLSWTANFSGHPTGMAYDGKGLWIGDSCEGGNTLYRFTLSGQIDAEIQLDGVGIACAWGERALAWDGRYLWYSASNLQTIYRLDLAGVFEMSQAQLPGLTDSAAAWGDYDNDGDLDLLLAGNANAGPVSKVYRNDGNNIFTEIGANLTGVYDGAVSWADYDNDGDLDILLAGCGTANCSSKVTRLYRNDNAGGFTRIFAPLAGVSQGAIAWGDYDNDGDLDLLLAGAAEWEVTTLYRNDKNDTFVSVEMPFTGLSQGSLDWGDYDNDGDLDLLLTGHNLNNGLAKLYRNDGQGSFTDLSLDLPLVSGGVARWGDYDNDGRLDFVLTGSTWNGGSQTSIYRNLGTGAFVNIGASITGGGAAVWGDYDNDGDLDLLLAEIPSSWYAVVGSKVYRNDGNGEFTDITAALPELQHGDISWADTDNDRDLDLFLSGGGISRIYRNGIATVNTPPAPPSGLTATLDNRSVTLQWNAASDAQTPPAGLTYNLRVGTSPGAKNVATSMSLGDGRRQTVTVGNAQQNTAWKVTNLLPGATYYWSVQAVDTAYAGSPFVSEGIFSVPPYPVIQGFTPSSGVVGATVSITGSNLTGATSVLFHDASASFTVQSSSLILANVPMDATTGPISISTPYGTAASTASFIVNGVFEDAAVQLAGVRNADAAWGDYDNDGDLDVLLVGNTDSGPIAKVYRNNGGIFNDINAGLAGVYDGTSTWGDYDSDGDLDISLTGCGNSDCTARITRVYRNNGAGNFTTVATTAPGVSESTTAWGDYDNDGDMDILVAGYTGGGSGLDNPAWKTMILRSDGKDNFTPLFGLAPVYGGTAAWGDYDGDGDLDLVLAGCRDYTCSLFTATILYRNDGNDSFTPVQALTPVRRGSASWGDYDNDGDLDLLLTGSTGWAAAESQVAFIYRNDGGTLTNINAVLAGVVNSSGAWGDFDNDGDLDILITGSSGPWGGNSSTKIYRNDGNGDFTDLQASLSPVSSGKATWGDYDSDGDLDILLAGENGARIYRNATTVANTPPTAPSGLTVTSSGATTLLRWNAANDAQTPPSGLTYNVRIGTSPFGSDVTSPMSLNNGHRQIASLGNTNHDTAWKLTGLVSGIKYYWSVQAIDSAFTGSPFAAEGSFTVSSVPILNNLYLPAVSR